MEPQTLATALDAALGRQLVQKPEAPDAADFLLAALERSTTRREQIVQRRIGHQDSDMTILT